MRDTRLLIEIDHHHIALGDLDGDHDLDMAVANLGSNDVSVFVNNGAAGFSAASGSPFAVGATPFAIVMGDFDEDGDVDLATTNRGSGTTSFLLNTSAAQANGSPGDDSFTAPAGIESINGLGGTDTVSFNFRLVDARISYQGRYTVLDGPGSHILLTGIERFVFTDGTVDNRTGSPLVDDLFYYIHNPDVWNAHVDAELHYMTHGWHELRDPNPLFDTLGYLLANPDVFAAGVNPLQHYDQFGWREGRDPSKAFDTTDYLSHNGDVAAAHIDPLAHFLQFGRDEGRLAFNDGSFG